LALLLGLGKGHGTGGFGRAQGPQDTTTDHRGAVHFLGQTAAVLLIRQAIHRERQPPRVSTVTSLWWPNAQTSRESAISAM
jgi:hypothetical protein